MSPDAASTPPRKRSWKRLIVALACVVAVTIIALLAISPKKEPVRVWFVGSTNELGVKKLVFEGTNGTARHIVVITYIAVGAIHPTKLTTGPVMGDEMVVPDVAGRTNFSFALKPPVKDVPYWAVCEFQELDGPKTPLRGLRATGFNFFTAHRMPRVAGLFWAAPESRFIPSTEIKE